MFDSFVIYSHPIVTVPAGDSRNVDFLVTEKPFRVENRVFSGRYMGTSLPTAFAYGDMNCTEAEGGAGSSAWMLQNAAGDATNWLPPFQSSERIRDIYELSPQDRVSFSYENTLGVDINNIQASWIGYKTQTERPNGKILRPAIYYLPRISIAPGASQIAQITIVGNMSLLVRSMICSPVDGNSVAVSFRNLASGYLFTNTPTLIENFTYQMAVASVPSANFRPLGFSPWVIPNRSTIQFTFDNIGTAEQEFQFALWGSNYSPVF